MVSFVQSRCASFRGARALRLAARRPQNQRPSSGGARPRQQAIAGDVALKRVESRTPPELASGITVVALGAGGRQLPARQIADAVDRAGLPIYVHSFDWTHRTGFAAGLADLRDVEYSRWRGQELAAEVRRYLAAFPGIPVTLVGFSAGCAVVLAAAECLPPESLDRILLLGPAVSCSYDLRRAALASRNGIDVFLSARDRFWLGLGIVLAGTADGRRQPAAGRVGFDLPGSGPGEGSWASRVRQWSWGPEFAWIGHEGGHSDWYSPAFVEAYLLSLLPQTAGQGSLPADGDNRPVRRTTGEPPARRRPLRGALKALFWMSALAAAFTVGWFVERVCVGLIWLLRALRSLSAVRAGLAPQAPRQARRLSGASARAGTHGHRSPREATRACTGNGGDDAALPGRVTPAPGMGFAANPIRNEWCLVLPERLPSTTPASKQEGVMPNFTMSIPHQLTRAEAKRRIQEGITQAQQHYGSVIGPVEQRWNGDTLDVTAGPLGQRVSGQIFVEDNVVRVEVALPWMLAMLAGTVRHHLEQRGRAALEHKP
jgi:putative polyhydroxyalkanoate system protein